MSVASLALEAQTGAMPIVLISGAGPAGLTAACWLQRYGFTSTIVERAPALVTGGYKIDVRGTGLQVLRRMDILDTVVAQNTDMQGAILVDRDGNVLTEMSGNEFGHRVGDDIEIIRGLLCQILRDHATGVEFVFGDSIQAITQDTDNVQVEFRVNEPRRFDLLIGADGLHSNVRHLAFGDEARFLGDLGLYLCVFSVPNYLNLDRVEMQYSELGRVASIWSARGDRNMRACFGFTSPSGPIDLTDRAQQEQALRSRYVGIGWEVPRLLDLMPAATDYYFDTAAQVEMDRWSRGRVVLVGDAGYCASPMPGQGTSLALIGAYVLAGELAAAKGDSQPAFDSYEKALRPFVQSNQELGRESAKVMRAQDDGTALTGSQTKDIIDRSTRRITNAANAISLSDYRSPGMSS
jgi:2-polyprenyl-6-methoxyphenol hydroxylase-like FAD-dependent oxidoreductase